MIKRLGILICSVFVAIYAEASTNWIIGNTTYVVDTLYNATVGPRIEETHINMHTNGHKANLFIAKVDIVNQYNDIRVLTAGDTVFGLCNIPDLALGHDDKEIKHIVGINADFAQIGNYKVPPAGYVVSDGCLIGNGGGYAPDFSSYFFSQDSKLGFARNVIIKATLELPSEFSIDVSINKNRGENEAILYNYRQGHFTGTNEWGAELVLKAVDGCGEFSGKSVWLEVASKVDRAGNMAIPEDGYVLSCHGSATAILYQMRVGDRLLMTPKTLIDGVEVSKMPSQLVGGSPIMLNNGVVDSARIDDADNHLHHLNTNQPRTAIGVSEDNQSIYFVVVDGRNKDVSDGVKVKVLAHVMRNIGCYNAMNCDGGGSSQFYVKGLGGPNGCRVRNLPVGGTYLRPVSNGIFAVVRAPEDKEISRIEIREKQLSLSAGEVYIPVVYGYNKYGVLIDTDVKDIKIRVAPEVGTVENNRFIANSICCNTDFMICYKEISHTIPMYLNGGGPFISEVSSINTDGEGSLPEYYTLQGVKISRPLPGQLVIERRGGQFAKIIYK